MGVAPNRVPAVLALMAAAAGCTGAVVVYLGLVDAVPIVDFNTDLDRQLRREGARQVLLGGLPIGLAGALLIAGGAKWAGGIVISCAFLIMLLAYAKSSASWVLLAVLVLAGLVGCVRLLIQPRSR
jgi:hypothetical protein